jgi:hypothetical protein
MIYFLVRPKNANRWVAKKRLVEEAPSEGHKEDGKLLLLPRRLPKRKPDAVKLKRVNDEVF